MHLRKNLQKQVWTGNQLPIQRQDRLSNLGCIGAKGGKYCYATCFPKLMNFIVTMTQIINVVRLVLLPRVMNLL